MKEKVVNSSTLTKLASYYLEVISHDESAEPSTFARSKYGNPDYIELPFFPGITQDIEEDEKIAYARSARTFWNGKRKSGSRQVPIIGYPLYAQYHESKKSGWRGFFIKPLFIFEVDEDDGNQLSIREPEFPLLNRDVI